MNKKHFERPQQKAFECLMETTITAILLGIFTKEKAVEDLQQLKKEVQKEIQEEISRIDKGINTIKNLKVIGATIHVKL